jgi:hypothetical protein
VLSLHRLVNLGDGDDMECEDGALSETTAESRWPARVEMRRGGGDCSAEEGLGDQAAPRRTSMAIMLTKPLHRLLHVSKEGWSGSSQRLSHESHPPYGKHLVQIGASIQIWPGPWVQRVWFSDLPL